MTEDLRRQRSLHCKPGEQATIRARAAAAGKTVSRYVLDLALADDPDRHPVALTEDSVNRHSILPPNRRAKLTPLSGTAEVVPVVNRGDPRGFV